MNNDNNDNDTTLASRGYLSLDTYYNSITSVRILGNPVGIIIHHPRSGGCQEAARLHCSLYYPEMKCFVHIIIIPFE